MPDKNKVMSTRAKKIVKGHTGETKARTVCHVPERISSGVKGSPRKTTLDKDKLMSQQQNSATKVMNNNKPNSLGSKKPIPRSIIKSSPQIKGEAKYRSTTRKETDKKGNKF